MGERSITVPRRTVLRQSVAAAAFTAIARPAFAVPDTIKIGLVASFTGNSASAEVGPTPSRECRIRG